MKVGDAEESRRPGGIAPGVTQAQFCAWYREKSTQPKGDFDWSEIDQSRSVGAETSYVPFFTPLRAWFESARLFRSINTSPG